MRALPPRLPSLIRAALGHGWSVDVRWWGETSLTLRLSPGPPSDKVWIYVEWRRFGKAGGWRLGACDHHRPMAKFPADRRINLGDVPYLMEAITAERAS